MKDDIKFENTNYDIKINEEEYVTTNGLKAHYLKLILNGKDLNPKIINMLRRVCTNYIPVYAYPPDLINIIENTSIAFNNDMMRLDLSLLPIYNVDPGLFELDEEYWQNVNYADKDRKRHENEKTIEFFVSRHNNSSDIIRVTTNDAQVYINGEQVEMYDKKYPISLIKLKGNQTFKCHMKGVLGIGERRDDGALWKSCKNAYYWPNDDGSYNFTIKGNEMFSEYNLLIKSCKFIIFRLTKIKNLVANKKLAADKIVEIILDDEDHTLGEPINFELQTHADVPFCGFSKPDHSIKSVNIKFKCCDAQKIPSDIFIESIDIVINKINKLGYELTKLSNAHDKKMPDNKKKSGREKDDISDEDNDSDKKEKDNKKEKEKKKKR
jgi:DNA-directed RNA polymerase subunit L